MNFVAQIEDHLRDLGAEARKNHPGVKEASERAIIHLRSLQTQYVAAVRRAGASSSSSAPKSTSSNAKQRPPSSGSSISSLPAQHPTTALFQSQDVLRPFLLAANYSNASYELLAIALESMQLLLRGDAVCPEDGMQIARVLVIQSWGCAGTLGLGAAHTSTGGNSGNAVMGRGEATSAGVGGMIHAASSSVSGALGGIAGMVIGSGGHHSPGNDGTSSSSGTGSHQQQHQHYHSNRSPKEDQSIALKTLQTITLLVDSHSVKLTQDMLGSCLSACLLLGAGQTYDHDHSTGSSVGAGVGATFRERVAGNIGQHHHSAAAKDGGAGGVGFAGSVKRAALATTNRVLSILFERAKDVIIEHQQQQQQFVSGHEVGSEAAILGVAERTMRDLCTLARRSSSTSSQSQLTTDLTGPFSVAAKEGLSPSPTTSLALIDMIMKQICTDLFQVCFNVFGSTTYNSTSNSNDTQKSSKNSRIEFAIQIITQAFQLGQSLLGSQYCYHVTKLSLESSLQEVSSNKPSSSSSSPSDLMDFCLYYYTTSLAATLLTNYLSSPSEEFYANFDEKTADAAGEGGGSNGNAVTISRMALDMIKQLVSFVSEATESYHKSDDFEDGYIFTQTERESFDIGRSTSTSNNPSATSSSRPSVSGPTSAQPLPVASISNEKLWRSFLALEALCNVVSSLHIERVSWMDATVGSSKSMKKDGTENILLTVGMIAKAASDFATISASNRERILHLLMAAQSGDRTLPSTSHMKSEVEKHESNKDKMGTTSAASDTPTSDSENSNVAAALAAKVTDALVIDSVEIPVCDAGATTWLAFKCILYLVKSLKDVAILIDDNTTDGVSSSRCHILTGLVNASFAPSVSMLQHFIRRMLGSPVIVSQTLLAYEELCRAAMTVDSQYKLQLIMSLCKLCLPSWGKRRPNCQLKEYQCDSLWTMLWILHSNFDKISADEWDIILSTLDQLAIISISSSKLPKSYSQKAKSIAGCFIRLPSFTTCFTSDSLSRFISALIKLSEAVSFVSLVDQSSDVIVRENSESSNVGDASDTVVREPSIGGKLISFAGRAFGGGTPAQSTTATSNASFRRSASIGASQFSKTYSQDFRESTTAQMASMKISTPRSVIQKIPLALLLVVTVAEANSYRLCIIEEIVAKHLCEIVAKSSSAELQSFAMEALIHFMPVSLSKSDMSLKYGSGPLMVPDRENKNESPLEVLPIKDTNNPKENAQSDKVEDLPSEPRLLKVLCQTIQRSTQVDTAERGLNALHVVLEGAGHDLAGENLVTVIHTLSVLSGCDSTENDESANRSAKQWANVCTLAFQNLKLILDDFLEPMASSSDSPLKSIEARDAILDCCVAFGRSRHDVNTSLTATGMLWSLADRDSSPGTTDVVLSKLAFLAMDKRPELRNCSVNTLFSCVVGLGDQFTNEQWKKCLNDTIFGIMNGITAAMDESDDKKMGVNGDASKERYKVAVHHSRDSARKQWANTMINVLRGLERVLRLFFPQLLETMLGNSQDSWFLQTWKEILQVSFDSAILAGERETLDMRLAGVELMTLCAQLSSTAGLVATGASARVGTNMEVVGGALRSVRAAVEDKVQEGERSTLNHPELDSCRQELFDLSFDKLNDFRLYLEENKEEESEEAKSHFMIDTLLTQVLTKLTGELAKLYECCKNEEMEPVQCDLQLDVSIENNDSYESRFLHLLLVSANNAGNDKNSRYLNQVQRGVMSLLQVMASNSSLRAFDALATISGDYMFVRPRALSSKPNGDYGDDDHGEIFELEAAKTVASAFDSDDLSNEAKVAVMCSVLLQYCKIYGNSEDIKKKDDARRKTSEARYDIITTVIDSGLEAAACIDSNTDDKTILDSIWDRIIATVSSLLLPPAANRYEGYAHHSKSILNIVAIVLSHLPVRMLSLAEPMLENGANRAVVVAFECNEKNEADSDIPYLQAAEGAIHVFLACFMGLCQKSPTCPAVVHLTNQILGDTIESEGELSEKAGLQSKTRQSLAIAVCESLRTTTSQDLLVGVFPLLCRLTNVENDGLRRAAGKILAGINLSEAISRERQRAEEADTRAREIEEENVAMLEEIEYLQAENEELQRQLAVFSESSDFT